MNNAGSKALLGLLMGLAAAGSADAAVVLVNANIATSTTWTANNIYRLQTQIYVLPGATLTIEPGTLVASTTGLGGALAVTRGARIFVDGTEANPVIMTSTSDVATWTGGDPTSGNWRAACNEWGNLTLMGRAFISNGPGQPHFIAGNTAAPNPNNVSAMEGLVAAFPGDPNVLYGGGNDNDDSGSISYLSLRYGGRVLAVANELNGLSMGGIGRETDVHHIDIMNNVDDGIETWGGTVNYKYINIWNIGDDSFDVDQGWRGKLQFGLIVQGYSIDAAQGGGIGDNIFETDGAEDSDCQPVTTSTIYNVTAIGQPAPGSGDHATAWRDNARVQYRNCIFMDLGDRLVSFDNIDGDGSHGYGFTGTLSWAATWTTPFTATSTVNPPAVPAAFYTAQSAGSAAINQGRLAEITNCVFFRNLAPAAYTESDLRGVTLLGLSNPAVGNVVAPFVVATPNLNTPVTTVNRGGVVSLQGGTFLMLPVTGIDPRPANAAMASLSMAPNDGFFTPANYRGGFAPGQNWICGWTAADAFGFSIAPPAGCDICAKADLNCDGVINTLDLGSLLANWTLPPALVCSELACLSDLNGDGIINTLDLGLMLAAWTL